MRTGYDFPPCMVDFLDRHLWARVGLSIATIAMIVGLVVGVSLRVTEWRDCPPERWISDRGWSYCNGAP